MSYFLIENKFCIYEFVFSNWFHEGGLNNKGEDS